MDEEFAHDGGEGDFGEFLLGQQALVEGFEDGVELSGGECRHVECTADFLAAAADGAFALMLATVIIVGSQSA